METLNRKYQKGEIENRNWYKGLSETEGVKSKYRNRENRYKN